VARLREARPRSGAAVSALAAECRVLTGSGRITALPRTSAVGHFQTPAMKKKQKYGRLLSAPRAPLAARPTSVPKSPITAPQGFNPV
jgi:hypothetical protein